MKKIIALVLVFVVFSISPAALFCETVLLDSGEEVEGKILERTAEFVKIEVEGVPLTYYFEKKEERAGKSLPLAKGDGTVPTGVFAFWERLFSPLAKNSLVFILGAMAAVLGAFLVALIRRSWPKKRRRHQLELIAQELGFMLHADLDYTLRHYLKEFQLSRHLRAQPSIYNVLSGERKGLTWKIFDYNTSQIKFSFPFYRYQTVVYVISQDIDFGHFFLTPRTLYWKIISFFKKESDPGRLPVLFPKDYVYWNKDQDAQKSPLFKALALVVSQKKSPYTIEARGKKMIIYRHKHLVRTKRISQFADEAQELLDPFLRERKEPQ